MSALEKHLDFKANIDALSGRLNSNVFAGLEEAYVYQESEHKSKAEMILDREETNQAQVGCRLDLVPPEAILEVGKVLHEAAIKYGPWNHRTIKVESHLNHAMRHIFLYFSCDKSEYHLAHAATRLLLALDMDIQKSLNKEQI